MRKSLIVALVFLFILLLISGCGTNDVVNTISVSQMEELFNSKGYSYKVSEDGVFFWEFAHSIGILIISDNEKSIQFNSLFNDENVTLEKINDWNMEVRYSKSYLDKDGDLVLELDLDLDGGVTKKRIYDYLECCMLSSKYFASYFDVDAMDYVIKLLEKNMEE